MVDNPILGFAQLIELVSALVIVWSVLRACVAAVQSSDTKARLLVADGVLAALSFITAATLLKTAALHSWHQIGMFAFILVFRTLLKKVFAWEHGQLASVSKQ